MELTLNDTLKPVLIPCYDLTSSALFLFSRAEALETDSYDFKLWEVCKATWAKPGVFELVEMRSVDAKHWARPALRISVDGATDTVDQAVSMAFGHCSRTNYVRIQPFRRQSSSRRKIRRLIIPVFGFVLLCGESSMDPQLQNTSLQRRQNVEKSITFETFNVQARWCMNRNKEMKVGNIEVEMKPYLRRRGGCG